MPFIYNNLLSIWIRGKNTHGIRKKTVAVSSFPSVAQTNSALIPRLDQIFKVNWTCKQRQIMFPDMESHVLWELFGRYYCLCATFLSGLWLQKLSAWLPLDWALVKNHSPFYCHLLPTGKCQKQTECKRWDYYQWKLAVCAPFSFST